jgi:hypothetical protein
MEVQVVKGPVVREEITSVTLVLTGEDYYELMNALNGHTSNVRSTKLYQQLKKATTNETNSPS